MNHDNRPHFWIPDEEVQRVIKEPRGRTAQRDVIHAEHGAKLSKSLQLVKQSMDAVREDDSLSDAGLYVFKVELPEGEKVQASAELFSRNGMRVNAVKDERRAVVSTTKQQFQILKNRVDKYTANGANKTYFDHIEDIVPYLGPEKNSSELRKRVYIDRAPETVDIQLMLIPNLQKNDYDSAIRRISEKVAETRGTIQQEPYYLSDSTPVIRVIIPSNALRRYENDSAIYRIEETRFFSAKAGKHDNAAPASMGINPEISMESLPVVVVLDSGVNFVAPFDALVVDHWKAPYSTGGDCDHGTKVASKVAFANLGLQAIGGNVLTPRARIIDCNILDGSVPENVMIQRIQMAVNQYASVAKIFNLSANATSPIEGDEMSIVGFELDALQLKYGVQFVVSAGNHSLWTTENSIDDILDDDDSRIAPPADSMLSIAVGSVVATDHAGSLSGKNMIAPYSRRGPGFTGFIKPDMCAYGGTIILDENGAHMPDDVNSVVMTKNGSFELDVGTSFAAPIISGDLAEMMVETPEEDVFLAKALLYHNAQPVWDEEALEEEELAFAHKLYGRGIPSVSKGKYSSGSRVTFVRTGVLNRVTKERVTIYMPEILAAQKGRNVAKVSITCISQPPVDRTKGSEYLGAYIRASLKKSHPAGRLLHVDPDYSEGRKKWDICHQTSKMFSTFNAGDWQVWLELFSRWDEDNVNVPYALVVTIEDASGTLDVYNEVKAQNRYQAINTLRIKVDA